MICRGNQGQLIFSDDADRRRYLELLQEIRLRFDFRLYAYVLMGNHVHHLIEVGQTQLSKIMQNLLFRYTRYWNQRYRKVGHLFQGRHKAILCERESYLLELVRYSHLIRKRGQIYFPRRAAVGTGAGRDAMTFIGVINRGLWEVLAEAPADLPLSIVQAFGGSVPSQPW